MKRTLPATLALVLSMTGILQAAGSDDTIMAGGLDQAIFTLLVFGILLAVLWKYAWGPILSGLQTREEHIRKSIEDAEAARNEAEKSLAEYREQLAQAREEAQQIIDKGREAAARISNDLQAQAREEAQELRNRARQDIAAAKGQALQEIYAQTTALAVEVAGKIVQKSLDPGDHQQLLDESLEQLQNRQN